MNTLTSALGEDFFIYMAAAVLVGLYNGHGLYLQLKGQLPDPKKQFENLLIKIGAVIILAVVMYYNDPSVSVTLLKVCFPIGIYKIVQLLTGGALWWRHSYTVGAVNVTRTEADG